MQYRLSEREKQIIEAEFLYQERNSGIIGGYCETGFPIYYVNEQMAFMLGYANIDEFLNEIDGKIVNTIHPDDLIKVMKDLGGGYFMKG